MKTGRLIALCLIAILCGCDRGPARHEGASFTVGVDGKTVLWTTGPGAGNSLRMRTPDGSVKTLATGAYFEGPTLSPDGKTVIVATGAAFRAKLSLVSIDVASGKQTAFADVKDESHYSPAFSPDGKWVAYRGAAKPRSQSFGGVQWTDYDLYLAKADGSDIRRLTEYKAPRMTPPRWSPDGKQITFCASDKDGVSWLRGIDLQGKAVWEQLGKNNESMPVTLGDQIVIVSDRDHVGKYRLGILDIQSVGFKPITQDEGYFIDPQVAGGRLFVLEDVSHKMRFRVSEVDTATGARSEVVPESMFDEGAKP